MPSRVFSSTLAGLDARIIDVEVDVSPGLPGMSIVGMVDTSIRESRERVRSCLKSSKRFKYPLARISINLAPAEIYKYGTQFDLAVALGMLLDTGQIKFDPDHSLFIGELSLGGELRSARGVLAMVAQAKQAGINNIYLPIQNAAEASLIEGVKLFPCANFNQAVDALINPQTQYDPDAGKKFITVKSFARDFSEIAGQDFAKRGLEIAAAGGHNILMSGPPGAGKTMLAQAMCSVIPEPDKEKLLEIIKIYSTAGLLASGEVPAVPFRDPHHSVTEQAFVGGGRIPKPGEISLAHNGVLFLDEFAEFSRGITESLRQPLESGIARVTRVQSDYSFPAEFILVAAQNPCPCGYFGDDRIECSCTAKQILGYSRKISGPILDRIDLKINVKRIDITIFGQGELQLQNAPRSAQILERVAKARQLQVQRYSGPKLNAKSSVPEMGKSAELDKASLQLIYAAERKYHFSARTYQKIIKIARTIADLDLSPKIKPEHITEAIAYRLPDQA